MKGTIDSSIPGERSIKEEEEELEGGRAGWRREEEEGEGGEWMSRR